MCDLVRHDASDGWVVLKRFTGYHYGDRLGPSKGCFKAKILPPSLAVITMSNLGGVHCLSEVALGHPFMCRLCLKDTAL